MHLSRDSPEQTLYSRECRRRLLLYLNNEIHHGFVILQLKTLVCEQLVSSFLRTDIIYACCNDA